MSDFRIERGIGVVSIETILQGEELELCRADMRSCKEFEEAVGLLNSGEFLLSKNEVGQRQEFHEKKKNYRAGGLLLRVWKFAEKDTWLLLLAGVLLLVTSGISVLLPQIQAFLVDGFLHPSGQISNSWVPILASQLGIQSGTISGLLLVVLTIAFFGLLLAVIGFLRGTVIAKASKNIIERVRNKLYKKVQTLSLTGFSKRTPGDLITCLSRDTEQMRGFLIWLVPNLLQQVVTLVAIVVILFSTDWQLSILLIIPIPLLFFFVLFCT